MAGGTGGHVFPGLAVARGLMERGVPVAWLGTRRGLESRLVPLAGISLHLVSVGGLRGKGLWTRLFAPFRLLWALSQSLALMLRLRPQAVIGMGGFVSGPGGVAAWLTRRPLLIHEQNAVAGLTNRLLARIATRVLEAFPGSLPGDREATAVGNPVRAEISAIEAPRERLAGRRGPVRLLVFGGSQGALRINQTVPAAIAMLPPSLRPEILHQTGERSRDLTAGAYRDAGIEARVTPFIDDMTSAYAWADLAICRSGALTVSELAAAGLGAILIPFPAAVDDHQTRNAEYLTAADAACLLPESRLSAAALAGLLGPLLGDRDRLLAMATRARERARPQALEMIVGACVAAARREVPA
jgi:UDP-N-acetylglucosamine--N-acetylmuramyl-(pentapeptide) pyrophosphoryl-undecaprenol N-acetylglucosamine transferase